MKECKSLNLHIFPLSLHLSMHLFFYMAMDVICIKQGSNETKNIYPFGKI